MSAPHWLTSLDRKKIRVIYEVVAFVTLWRAVAEVVLMRVEQAATVGGPGVVSADHFARLFSTHGTIMVFFMAVPFPFLTGLVNYVLPLQPGARDMAFPRANSAALWLTGGAAGLMMASLAVGRFSTGGGTGYPPYTVFKLRAPGMGYLRMPLFCWTSLCTAILMVFATPPLTVATALLALDRYLGFHLFTNDLGGNMMNYANLFWLFGHPEVYILILPAFGIYSEVVSTFSAKRLYGYASLVAATRVIAVLSFTVWVAPLLHHRAVVPHQRGVRHRHHGDRGADQRQELRLDLDHVPGRGALHRVDALRARLHDDLRGRRLQRHHPDHSVPRLHGAQHHLPGRAIPQHADPGRPLRPAGRLHLLVPQGLRLSAGRALEADRLRLLGARLLPGFRAALRAGRERHGATSAPPPEYNFAVLPRVDGRDPFYDGKRRDGYYREAAVHEAIRVPRNGAMGAAIVLCRLRPSAFGLVWRIGWLAAAGSALVVFWLVARSFLRDTERTIPAGEIAATERRWHAALGRATPVPRQAETTPRNQGLAKIAEVVQ